MKAPGAALHRERTWSELHALGVLLSQDLETYATLDEVAAEFGSTKQRMYHETMVALGKLGYGLRARLVDVRKT